MLRRIEESEYFDADWYAEHYADVRLLGLSPAEHYLRIGASLLRDPGPDFSTGYYLASYPDVAQSGANPLWHYLAHGRDEGRRIEPSGYHLLPPPPDFPVPLLSAEPPTQKPARLIAYYLPQFHPIPENDAWWGEGFTEWTNVQPARPQLARHYQPHVPGELGYYDLRDTAVQHRQVELARLYGIEGFCFYFYWFAGKRLLETPIRNYLDEPSLDLPFCLCWANENWSRRWDGRDHDVLIAQDHSPEDDLAFIKHVAQYMQDPRYIRVDGKPLLLVYRPNLLPDPPATSTRWRDWCRRNGIGEIHLAYTQSFESNNPEDYGFDAAIEFPPNNSHLPTLTEHCRTEAGFQGRIYDWSALVERSFSYPSRPFTLYRGLCPSWDNTARRGANGTIMANSTPQRFTRWATNAIRDTKARFRNHDERLVFVNAWNEWAEGAHLEPDQRYGYAWLESIRVALACSADAAPVSMDDATGIAIALDVRQLDGLDEILQRCKVLSRRHHLFVTTDQSSAGVVGGLLEASGQEHTLHIDQHHGRGPCGFLDSLPSLQASGWGLVVRFSNASPGDGIRPASSGLFDDDFVEGAMARFATDPTLGMICPADQRLEARDQVANALQHVGNRMGLGNEEIEDNCGWRGLAFIARTAALAPIASLAFDPESFEPGSARYVPALPEAIERGLTLSPLAAGLRVAGAQDAATSGNRPRIVIASHDAHPHGAQFLALNMARTYGEMGFDVDMLVLGPGPLLDRFQQVATVHRIDPANDPASRTLRLLTTIRAAGAEIAIANTTVCGLLVPLLKQAGFRTVSLIHELPGILDSYQLHGHARAIADHADSIVFPARIVREGFETFVDRPVQQGRVRPQGLYLHNPHRTPVQRDNMRRTIRRQLGLAQDARIVLCAGYADHRKGLDLFAECCMQVMTRDPHAVAVWIGHADQDLLDEVQASIGRAGYADRFVFTGRVDNPQDYYTAADVYALTSREDPFPSVVLESLDAHVPVVSFAGVVGSEEVLTRGTGLLVPAFDTDAMAKAVGRLLDDPKLAGELASKGQRIVEEEFDFRQYLFDLVAIAGRPIPRVSVVVPNYNYARYLRERLESIERQTVPPYELIVLDDASTDDSVEVIREYLASCSIPTRLVVNDSNSGSVFRQWQRGVEMARGDFVWIAEADDLADPEFLQETLPAFSDPRVVISYTQSRQMDSEGEILCEHYLDYVSDIDRERWTRPYVADGREEIATAMHIKNTIPNVSAALFRRDALFRVLAASGDRIASYRNAGDWVCYIGLLETGAIAFSPQSLNSHRRHQSSVTVGNFNIRQLKEIVRVQRDTIRTFKLGPGAERNALAYAQRLFEQFGLASKEHRRIEQHPELRWIGWRNTSVQAERWTT